MPVSDAWDWPLLMYTGTVILRRTDKQFWKMTPRKLNTLFKTHIELKNPGEAKESAGFIDQII